jgi:hypothetical protein
MTLISSEERLMRRSRTRLLSPAALVLLLLLLTGPLAACAGITVTPLPPHMDQRGAR